MTAGKKNAQTCSTKRHHQMSSFQAQSVHKRQSAVHSTSMAVGNFPFSVLAKERSAFPLCKNLASFISLHRHIMPFIFQKVIAVTILAFR